MLLSTEIDDVILSVIPIGNRWRNQNRTAQPESCSIEVHSFNHK
jgi:hypothetical protein